MNEQLTLGSLFDGSGSFPFGGMLVGIKPIWADRTVPDTCYQNANAGGEAPR